MIPSKRLLAEMLSSPAIPTSTSGWRMRAQMHAERAERRSVMRDWSLAVDEPSCKSRNEHGKQRDIESMAQTGKILADIHWLGIITESDDEIEYQREQDAWYGSIEHIADM